tara:strand:- start:2062 stop:2637 length:576 start_codon:yes stop_codon:yes gene_type:complete
MADTTTTTYGLVKPEVGASEDTWGTKANATLDTIDDLLDGTTAIAPNLVGAKIGGVAITSTAAEINLLDGVTATTAELNLVDGVTATTAELNILDGVTATATEINLMDGVTATTAELNYSDGVTSAIQTQIDTKAPSASPSLTGTIGVGNTWTVVSSGADIKFELNGVSKMKLDTSGNLTVVGDVTAYGVA